MNARRSKSDRISLSALVASFLAAFLFDCIASAQTVVDAGTIQVSTIGHIFDPGGVVGPPTVEDFFIDQHQASGGGGLIRTVSANFDTNSQFSITISAPPGSKFFVRVPASRSVKFGGKILWNAKNNAYAYYSGSVTGSFSGFSGTAPTFSGTAFISQDHLVFGFASVSSSQFSTDFSFSTVTLTGIAVLNQNIGLGTQTYYPIDYATWGNSSFYAMYSLPFGQTIDPGPFVSVSPVVPTLQIRPISSGAVVSWQTNFSNWVLETTSGLGGTNSWSVVTNKPIISGANCLITNITAQPRRYYRMRSQ